MQTRRVHAPSVGFAFEGHMSRSRRDGMIGKCSNLKVFLLQYPDTVGMLDAEPDAHSQSGLSLTGPGLSITVQPDHSTT